VDVRIQASAILAAVLLAACGSTPEHAARRADPAPPAATIPAGLDLPAEGPLTDPRQLLALVPASAEVVTITDFDAIRARLGVPDLTSAELMTDRTEFWNRADTEAVLLTDGVLREDSSVFELDHGFTQDDVDWELHFTGPGGGGWVLALRPDLDLAKIRGALGEPALAGARLLADSHLLVTGTATGDEPVWAMEPELAELVEDGAESAYLRKGCVPVRTALGPDATYDDQAALVAAEDPTYLRPLEAFAVQFGDQIATARLGIGRIDLHQRADLVDVWPATGSPSFADGFDGSPVADPGTGRIGLRVANPLVAAQLTLTELLPFAVCNEVEPFEEPTGL
jgi:hypothetical protein